jgi:hypothetical protein
VRSVLFHCPHKTNTSSVVKLRSICGEALSTPARPRSLKTSVRLLGLGRSFGRSVIVVSSQGFRTMRGLGQCRLSIEPPIWSIGASGCWSIMGLWHPAAYLFSACGSE